MQILSTLALSQLRFRLRGINRVLRAAVIRQGKLAGRLLRPDITPLCVTDDQVGVLLDDMDAALAGMACDTAPMALTDAERTAEEGIRDAARRHGLRLPFDELSDALALTDFEQEAVLLCAAFELDRSYERIHAYILDDLNRRCPCIESLCSLSATSLEERVARRAVIGRFGKLRRCGVLCAQGDVDDSLRQEIRLAPGVFATLTGQVPFGTFRDPDEAPVTVFAVVPATEDPSAVERLSQGLREGWITLASVWSKRQSDCDDMVQYLAARLSRPLRRFEPANAEPASMGRRCSEALDAARALGATLWIRLDGFDDFLASERARTTLAEILASSALPTLLSGTHPWRPIQLLATSRYAEIELSSPDFSSRQRMWRLALPEAGAAHHTDLAARYRMGAQDIHAAVNLARLSARLAGNGHAQDLQSHMDWACSTVNRKSTPHFATLLKPRRGTADLVLPHSLHQQVVEVAHFFRLSPHISDAWGFRRHESDGGGIKALFTGDSGTGKTLAAEVIAAEIQMPLLRIDLSQIVSKWIGETEKHLENAFREAEDAQAVLFFDEADALFGKRGEIRHGVDRYANLEVSYLLQRLESYGGLVILASNLTDNIDSAFARRFQVVLHFPRPGRAERHRLWQMAFPEQAPLDPSLDFDALSNVDLTGAGIFGAARTAALFAAKEGLNEIGKLHIVRAIAYQFRREARLVTPTDLGPYADLLREPS